MAGMPDPKEAILEVLTASSGLLWAAYAGFGFDPISTLGTEPGIMVATGVGITSVYSLLDRFGVLE
jgi:hypothetical protein